MAALIDGVDIHGRGTGSPTLEALLSPLTGNNDADRLPNVRDIAKTSADVRRCHVHAGSLPALILESIFQNGKRVGAVGLDTRSFSFKRDSCSAKLVLARSESEAAKPYWWDLRPCLVPNFDGAIFSPDWQYALWARFYTGAPRRRRRSVERYNIVKRA